VPGSNGSSAQADVVLQAGAHPVATLEQERQAMARTSLLPGRSCRNKAGSSASWANYGVEITKSTSLAIPASSRAKEPTRTTASTS
jgi:hypothetical protein